MGIAFLDLLCPVPEMLGNLKRLKQRDKDPIFHSFDLPSRHSTVLVSSLSCSWYGLLALPSVGSRIVVRLDTRRVERLAGAEVALRSHAKVSVVVS